jgi:hypothetical protein
MVAPALGMDARNSLTVLERNAKYFASPIAIIPHAVISHAVSVVETMQPDGISCRLHDSHDLKTH